MKKIKIAQIGTGHDHAPSAIRTLKLQSDIYDVVGYAVVPEDSKNLDRFSYNGNKSAYDGLKRFSVEEILNYPDLDAVCIETEDRALTKYALMAANRGLHIHMDKPGGIDDGAFDKLIDTAKAKNLVFHLGYMYRYNPAVMKLFKDIDAGKYGEIYAVEAQMSCLHEPDKRAWLGNYPGGMLYFLGCHLVDLVYRICGMPNEVIPLSTSIKTDGVTAQDFGMAVFKYPNGVSFVKSTAVEIGGYERRQLVVCGTKGTAEIKPLEWASNEDNGTIQPQTTFVKEAFSYDWGEKNEPHSTPTYGRYDAMLRAFADYINKNSKNPYDYEYERQLHKLILKACGGL